MDLLPRTKFMITTMTARISRMCRRPPIVVAVTIPSTHMIKRIRAMVHNIMEQDYFDARAGASRAITVQKTMDKKVTT
jgi:ABC-type antimicrobial peptide transport system permease subunit